MGAEGVTKVFLDWSRPALDQAVDFLTRDWKAGPLDLRDTLLVVPTRHAGRRLRERLAIAAAAHNSAVLIGGVETPPALFAPPPGRPLTDALSSQILWQRTLAGSRPGSLAALFPAQEANFRSAIPANAEHLARLRSLLAEEGHTFTSFAKAFSDRNPEPDRWTCLARIEADYIGEVEKSGLRDDATSKIAAAHKPETPSAGRVVILFVPDPPPLALTALAALSRRIPVTLCIHAPEAAADMFDAWGRPVPERWERTDRALRHQDIERCDDSSAMVEQIRRRIAEVPEPRRPDLAVGVAVPDTAARLRLALERDGVKAFDPAGASASNLHLFRIVRAFLEVQRAPSFEAFVALARLPDVLRRLEAVTSRGDILETLDDFQQTRIPSSCSDALSLAGGGRPPGPVAAALTEAGEWIRICDRQPLSAAIPAVLSRLYQGQQATDDLASSAEMLNGLLDRFSRVEDLCGTRESAADILLRAMDTLVQTADRPAGAVDLLGWLELAWEDAPAILLADMNEGLIPEAVTGDPFLPDNARQTMGLRDSRQRLARDAHTLEVILRCRKPGSVRLFVSRRNQRGDPLKPSRLLFQCAQTELAGRALHLMSDSPSPFRVTKRSPGWLFSPPLPEETGTAGTVSVTGLGAYLACPFMYYLVNVLRMEPVETAAELDAMAFGSVAHEALEEFANGEFRDASDAGLIETCLHGAVNRIFAGRHGSSLPLALQVQRDLLLQRMSHVALAQSALRAAGWRILKGEHTFSMPLGGLTLRGRIDRIDRHDDGRVRVMDYKTSHDATGPAARHLKKVTNRTSAAPWTLTADGKSRWADLQLPVYRRWCEGQEEYRKAPVECAYFVIPDAVTETCVLPWEGLDARVVDDAWRCAEEIARRVAAGIFWPPQSEPDPDNPFRRLFFEDVKRHLDASFVRAMEARA
jgi:ATP-dependent helicase/nuclease subunit B